MNRQQSFDRKLPRVLRRAWGLIYQPQVKFHFPIPVLDRMYRSLPPVPAGYVVRSPEGDGDLAPWAALLDAEGGYGRWDAERVRREIVGGLIAPDAASLAFHGTDLVGCSSTTHISLAPRRVGLGMYLVLRPDHRGHEALTGIVIWRTMWYFVREGYEQAIGTTDPRRHSALYIYLRVGAIPIKDSLFSHWQWRVIERRLRPALERRRRRAATAK